MALTTLTRSVHADLDSPYGVKTRINYHLTQTVWQNERLDSRHDGSTARVPWSNRRWPGWGGKNENQPGSLRSNRIEKRVYGNTTLTGPELHSASAPRPLRRTVSAPPPTNQTGNQRKCAISYKQWEATTHSKNSAVLAVTATTKKQR